MTAHATTVAYMFIVSGGLPLWPVWREYFAGCPKGSYSIVIHSQNPLNVSDEIVKHMARVKGGMLPPAMVQNSSLRFSFHMVEAMFALYRRAARVSLLQHDGMEGYACRPSHVKISSATCAPIASCTAFHKALDLVVNTTCPRNCKNVLSKYWKTAPQCQHRFPTGIRKAPLWITLGMHAVAVLLRAEQAIMRTWRPTNAGQDPADCLCRKSKPGTLCSMCGNVITGGAYDEIVVATEGCARMHADVYWTHTYTDWCRSSNGHPTTFKSAREVRIVCDKARHYHKFFARKFAEIKNVQEALKSCIKSTIPIPNPKEGKECSDWIDFKSKLHFSKTLHI